MENTIIKNADMEYYVEIEIPLPRPIIFLLSDDFKEQKSFLNSRIKEYPENEKELSVAIQILEEAHKVTNKIDASSINISTIKMKIGFKFIKDLNNFCSNLNL